MNLSPGDLIDQKYRIVGLLGQGGMGRVYAAENVRIDRRVAIKVLHRISSPSDVARFEREARAAQVGSPNIVQVYDLGNLADGAPFMVMECLSGESLGERIVRQGRLEPSEIVPIAVQILDGLAAAHRVGVVHRDLKPDNVFLARSDGPSTEIVKLLDFGISKFVDSTRASVEPSLTKSGMAVGTPHYMSPEQVQGLKELDRRSDLYSLGVILYQCLSGRLPFATEEIVPLLSQILLESPEPLTTILPGIDSELADIVSCAMARRADERYQSAAELRAALLSWETQRISRAAPTTDLPAVEVGGRASSAVLQRGLIGVVLACVSAGCVVGLAKLVQGTNDPKVAAAVQASVVGVPTTGVASNQSAAASVSPVAPAALSGRAVEPRLMDSPRASSKGTGLAAAPTPTGNNVAPSAAASASAPAPTPATAQRRPNQVPARVQPDGDNPEGETANRHMSRLPDE